LPALFKVRAVTQHVWKMEEIIYVENNSQIYYKSGGTTNTHNYDNDKITAQTLALTWEFTNADQTKMNNNHFQRFYDTCIKMSRNRIIEYRVLLCQ
jgi:hypothetical protein